MNLSYYEFVCFVFISGILFGFGATTMFNRWALKWLRSKGEIRVKGKDY